MLLLIVRYIIHRRQRSEEEDEDLAVSIEKLKRELQQSADTIIKRLGSHVTKLEGLLREADDRRVRLETRVADAQRLEWALRQRIEELERRLTDLGQPSVTPSAPMQERIEVSAPAGSMQPQEAQRTDGDEFAAVLHASILREQARTQMPPSAQPAQMAMPQAIVSSPPPPPPPVPAHTPIMPPPHAAVPPASPAAPPLVSVHAEPAQTGAEAEPIEKARALLCAGRAIEEVARETGVEIGALRLMRQMTQRD